jgi:hypothetical protein
MMEIRYNTGVNHIKSDGLLSQRRHPFSSRNRGADTMSHSIPNPSEQSNTEQWRDIPGYVGRYQVSDLGRVRTLMDRAGKQRGTPLIFKPTLNKSGYVMFTLTLNGKPKRWLAHRLVLLAFCGPSPLQGNHKNGIRSDNRVDNLEYCTAQENVRHAFDVLKRNPGAVNKLTLTRGEYRALVKIWRYSPFPTVDVRASTLKNLKRKAMIFRENIEGVDYVWLSDKGKAAIDLNVKVYGAVTP